MAVFCCYMGVPINIDFQQISGFPIDKNKDKKVLYILNKTGMKTLVNNQRL